MSPGTHFRDDAPPGAPHRPPYRPGPIAWRGRITQDGDGLDRGCPDAAAAFPTGAG